MGAKNDNAPGLEGGRGGAGKKKETRGSQGSKEPTETDRSDDSVPFLPSLLLAAPGQTPRESEEHGPASFPRLRPRRRRMPGAANDGALGNPARERKGGGGSFSAPRPAASPRGLFLPPEASAARLSTSTPQASASRVFPPPSARILIPSSAE